MKSMTGYGAGEARVGDIDVSVMIKAVNGRFLDGRFHLPKEYFSLEAQLKRQLSRVFRRGTVDVFVSRRGASQTNVQLNHVVAKKWVQAHKELARALNLPIQNSTLWERLSLQPQIFDVRDRAQVDGKEKKALDCAFSLALQRCEAEREREGKAIKSHLKEILKALGAVVGKMDKLRQKANLELQSRLQERLKRLGLESSVEPGRFAQELVIYLDKGDIAEELERLREHVQMCEKYLVHPEEQGKKLDFYSQELLREVNTIGSKANYAPLTEQVVKAKGLIEAMKEQVQNVE